MNDMQVSVRVRNAAERRFRSV